ncbi:hypothetical protein EC968_009730 [Mortierella alpina]|nr:hypothetical protein EC968_009730 [Mortierella alpina]
MKYGFLLAIFCLSSLASADFKACSDYFEAFSFKDVEVSDEVVPNKPIALAISGDIKEIIPSDTKLHITADQGDYVSLLYSSLKSPRELYTKARDQTFDLQIYLPTEVKLEGKDKVG